MNCSARPNKEGSAFMLGQLGSTGPEAILSTLASGDMEYRPEVGNPLRDTWLASVGFDPKSALAVQLVHSRLVVRASKPHELSGVQADGILCDNPDMAVVLTVADCMPIFIYDAESGAFGVLHSGWKGTGILEDAVKLMARCWGSTASNITALLGPCIGSCCYAVDEDRAKLFANNWGTDAVKHEDGTKRLDLKQANLAIAEKLGLCDIACSDDCTACRTDMGSYRRQGAHAFSRMAAVAGYPKL